MLHTQNTIKLATSFSKNHIFSEPFFFSSSTLNVMFSQSQYCVGSSVSSYLGLSSVNWQSTKMTIPVCIITITLTIIIIIIILLQCMVLPFLLDNSFHNPAAINLPPEPHSLQGAVLCCRAVAISLIFCTQLLYLFCFVPLVQATFPGSAMSVYSAA